MVGLKMSQENVFRKFQSQAEQLTEKVQRKEMPVPSHFGLCSKCTFFIYRRTKLGTEIYYCNHYDIRKKICSINDPIVVCNSYEENGQPSINFMWNIATFIDVEKKNIGFDIGKEVKSYQLNDDQLVPDY
jgi:hypothetical protein